MRPAGADSEGRGVVSSRVVDGTPNALEASAQASLREQRLVARVRHTGGDLTQLPDKLGAIGAATRIFEEARVPYALIGGLAVGIRSGVPRATLDVDFAVTTDVDLTALTARFTAAGFRFVGRFAHSLNFEHPSGEPVQIAFDVGFDPMVRRAEVFDAGEITLRVVTRDDLLAMKRRAADDPGRRRSKALRDRADIALLEGDVGDPNEGW